MSFTVRIDDRAARALLKRFEPAAIIRILRKAVTKAGAAEKAVLRPFVPLGLTGNLRRSVSSRRIRSNPAIGAVIGPMGRLGSHRFMVAEGTKPHMEGNHHHPGAKPHPFIPPAAAAAERAGLDAATKVIDEVTR
jgi:hypothetical protein